MISRVFGWWAGVGRKEKLAGWLAGGWKGGPVMAIEEKLSGWWLVKAEIRCSAKCWVWNGPVALVVQIKLARGSLLQLNTDKDCTISIFLASCWIKILIQMYMDVVCDGWLSNAESPGIANYLHA
ncbi:hypothetical protein MP228_004300 [Amoeboaphelidium protococcarum]|nr:hypothetical protein MP228_004300 [Amoeboaphelidium protococcarum]